MDLNKTFWKAEIAHGLFEIYDNNNNNTDMPVAIKVGSDVIKLKKYINI